MIEPIVIFSVRGTVPTPKNVDIHAKHENEHKRSQSLKCSWCGEKGCAGSCTLPPEAFMGD